MADTLPNLMPCPFCGGDARLISGGPGNHFVKCDGCGASSDDRSIEGAAGVWNRRADASARLHDAINSPTLPNADELEVVAWLDPVPMANGYRVAITAQPIVDRDQWLPCVTLSSAQAQIERLTRERDEALEHIEQLSELLKIIKEHWIEYDHVFSISVHEADQFRSALSGGTSNG